MAAVNSVQGGLRLPLAGIASPRLLMCSASMGAEGSVTLQLREAVEAPDSNGQTDTSALTIGYTESDLIADIQGSIQAAGHLNRAQQSNGKDSTVTVQNIQSVQNTPIVKKSRPKTSSPTRHGPQQCQVCSKVFGNASALAKHKLTHSDERKYVCSMCSKAFKRQDHLNGHMLTHRNKKPYECKAENCGKSYCDARSLRRHTENHHSSVAMAATTPNQVISSTGPLSGLSLSPATASGDASSPHGSNCIQFNGNGNTSRDESKSSSPSLPAAGNNNEGLSRQQLDLISQIMQQTKTNVSFSANNVTNGQKGTIQRPRTWNMQTQLQQTQNQTKSETDTQNTSKTSSSVTTATSPVKVEQKPVECNLCHRKFKNIPALNGHMRLHGGYFKKDAESKKCDKKEVSGPPLQTASVGIRALIEEKIISKRGKDLKSSFAIPATPPSRRLADTDNFVIPKTMTAANINTTTTTSSNNSTQNNGISQTATQTNSTSTITVESNSIQLSKNLNKQITASIETKDATLIELLKRASTKQTTQTTTVLLPSNVSVSSPVTPTSTTPLALSISGNAVKTTPLALTISQNPNGCNDVYTLAYSTDSPSTFFNENDMYNVSDTAMLLESVDSIQLLQNSTSSSSSQLGDLSAIGEYTLSDSNDLNGATLLSQYTPSRQIQAVLNSPLPESLAEFSALHSKDFVLYGTTTTSTASSVAESAAITSDSSNSPPPSLGIYGSACLVLNNQLQHHHQDNFVNGNNNLSRNASPALNQSSNRTNSSPLPTSPISYPTPPASHEGITQTSPFLEHNFGDANSYFDDKKNINFLDDSGLFKTEHIMKDARLSDCEQILKLKHELFNDSKVVLNDSTFFKTETKNAFITKATVNQGLKNGSNKFDEYRTNGQLKSDNGGNKINNLSQDQQNNNNNNHNNNNNINNNGNCNGNGSDNMDEFGHNLSFLDESQNFLEDSRNPSSPLSAAFFTSTMSSAEEVKEALQEVLPNDENITCEQTNDMDLYYLPSLGFQSQIMLNSDDPLLSSSPKDFANKHQIHRFDFDEYSPAKRLKIEITTAETNGSVDKCIGNHKTSITNDNNNQNQNNKIKCGEIFLSPSSLSANSATISSLNNNNVTNVTLVPNQILTKDNLQLFNNHKSRPTQIVRRNIVYKSNLKKLSSPYYTPSPILNPDRVAPGLYNDASKSGAGDVIDFDFNESPCVNEFVKKSKVNIGSDFQAYIPSDVKTITVCETDITDERDQKLWDPCVTDNDWQIRRFVDLAKSSAFPLGCHSEEVALKLLLEANGDTHKAILKMLHETPTSIQNRWQPHEVEIFLNGLEVHGKKFFRIAKDVTSKTTGDCVQFYYFWKKLCVDYKISHLSSEPTKADVNNGISNSTNHQQQQQPQQQQQQQQEIRPHVCEMPDCSASFTSKAALHGHTRIHCIGRNSNAFSANASNGQILSGYLTK